MDVFLPGTGHTQTRQSAQISLVLSRESGRESGETDVHALR